MYNPDRYSIMIKYGANRNPAKCYTFEDICQKPWDISTQMDFRVCQL